ncbi:unnamed protein product, partial [Rotaria sordida]
SFVLAFDDVSDRQWTPMMESAFDVIFKLADGPIEHIENIIKNLAVKTGVKLGDAGNQNNQNQLPQHQQQHHHHHSQMNTNPAALLVRFLNCLGKAAVGIAYYLDCTVKDELRRKEAKLIQYKNIVERILLKPSEYYQETSQLSATRCLCKLMLLSFELYETHAKMVFDLLKNSTFESVRVAIMVLMNDFYLK